MKKKKFVMRRFSRLTHKPMAKGMTPSRRASMHLPTEPGNMGMYTGTDGKRRKTPKGIEGYI